MNLKHTDFIEWVNNPVTKHFFKSLMESGANVADNAKVNFDSMEYTALKAAHAEGYTEAVSDALSELEEYKQRAEEN